MNFLDFYYPLSIVFVKTLLCSFCLSGSISSFASKLTIRVHPKVVTQLDDQMAYNCTSLEHAKELALAKPADTVRIILSDGYHCLRKTVSFDQIAATLIIEAEHIGKALLVDDNPVQSAIDVQKNVVSFPVSKPVYSLLKNYQSVPMCCSGEMGEIHKKRQFSSFRSESIKNTYSALFHADDIALMEKGCLLFVYCKWIQYRLQVMDIDKVTNRVTLSGASVNVNYITNDSQVYYSIHNSRPLLNPGTFCCIDNRVYYQLAPHENPNHLSFSVPQLETLLNVSHTKGNVSLSGLTFISGVVQDIYSDEYQAGARLPFVLSISNSSHVSVSHCEFRNAMGYCVGFSKSSDCSLEQCYFHDLGGGGIKVGTNCQRIHLNNNLIKGFGRFFPSCVGVYVLGAHDVRVTHHTICDGFYSGISVGHVWGYGQSLAYNNYIANNHIHHLMQGVLSDGAGIYTLGVQPGTVIENNYVHDVVSRAFNAAGSSLIYLDEGSSHIQVRNNVCLGSHTGFHQHYGKNNQVKNNVFAYTNLATFRLSNAKKSSDLEILNNLVLADCGQIYSDTLAKYAILEANKTWKGTFIDKQTGVSNITKSDNLASKLSKYIPVEKLLAFLYTSKHFPFGVSTKELKRKAKLTNEFMNQHNQMVRETFPTFSSYFERVYK